MGLHNTGHFEKPSYGSIFWWIYSLCTQLLDKYQIVDSGSSYTKVWNKSLSKPRNHHISSLIKHNKGTRTEVRDSVEYTEKVLLNTSFIVTHFP